MGRIKTLSGPQLDIPGLEPSTVDKAFKTKHIKQLCRYKQSQCSSYVIRHTLKPCLVFSLNGNVLGCPFFVFTANFGF